MECHTILPPLHMPSCQVRGHNMILAPCTHRACMPRGASSMRVHGKYGSTTCMLGLQHHRSPLDMYARRCNTMTVTHVHATGCDMITALHPLHMHARGSCFMVIASRTHHTDITGNQGHALQGGRVARTIITRGTQQTCGSMMKASHTCMPAAAA